MTINPFVRWAFYAFAFSIPIEYPTGLPTQIHTITAALFLLIAGLLQPGACFRRPRGAVWWLAGYLWVYLALVLFTEHLGDAFNLFVNSFLVAMVFWAGSNLVRDVGVAGATLVAFILGCTALAVLELAGIGLSVLDPGASARLSVFGQDANFIGGNMALGLIALLTLISTMRHPRAFVILAIVVGALMANSLVVAGSRGAFAGIAAGLLAFVIASSTPRTALRHLSIVVLVAGALLAAGVSSEPARRRVEKTLTTGNMSGRERIYPEAWQMVVEKPVRGWGPADARYELRLRTAGWEVEKSSPGQVQRDAHNLVLESLIATGLAGTIPLLICIALSVHAAWQGRAGPLGAAPFALIATVLALSLSANWSMSKEVWLFLGYGLAARRPRGWR